MLVAALEAEVADYLARHAAARDERGHAEVVRNGHGAAAEGDGRGRDRRGAGAAGGRPAGGRRASSRRSGVGSCRRTCGGRRRWPRCCRCCTCTGCRPATSSRRWRGCSGEDAAGLSPTAIARLVKVWEAEYAAFRRRDLADRDYVYVWADGVHFNIRLEDDRLCTLVVIGARPDGTKEVIAVEDGYRESTESWLTLLRDLKRRGMRAPVVAVGDRRARLLGGRAGRLARDAGRDLLGPPDRQRAGQAAHAAPAEGEAGAARHDVRREPGRLPGRDRRASRPSTPPSTPRRSRRSPPTRSAC